MVDPSQPRKKANPLLDFLMIGVGLLLMFCAAGLMLLMVMGNGRSQATPPAANEPAFTTNGKQIHHVSAGAQTIDALAYSSQAPVIVMFNADW